MTGERDEDDEMLLLLLLLAVRRGPTRSEAESTRAVAHRLGRACPPSPPLPPPPPRTTPPLPLPISPSLSLWPDGKLLLRLRSVSLPLSVLVPRRRIANDQACLSPRSLGPVLHCRAPLMASLRPQARPAGRPRTSLSCSRMSARLLPTCSSTLRVSLPLPDERRGHHERREHDARLARPTLTLRPNP